MKYRNHKTMSNIIPAKRQKGFIHLEPPMISDAIPTRYHKDIVTDLNNVAQEGSLLNTLGKALYTHRISIEKENVILTKPPKGYFIRQDTINKQLSSISIVGHPSGMRFNAANFVPHLLWLETCSQLKNIPSKSKSDCACPLCPLPAATLTLSREFNLCTVDSFKMMEKVEIRSPRPNEFYPKAFTIPLPVIKELDIFMVLSKQNGDDDD